MATPIGNLGDITRRALDVLARADLIACEDTRVTRKLLSLLDLPSAPGRLVACHDAGEAATADRLLARVADGTALAVVSDAGMPLVSDPGYRIVAGAREAGLPVTVLPGASALPAALALAGLPCDQVAFLGFPPRGAAERRRAFALWRTLPLTLVLFEAPTRLAATLADLAAMLGPRRAAVVREISKLHEDVRRGLLTDLATAFTAVPPPKGEITLVVAPPERTQTQDEARSDLDAALTQSLAGLSVRDAADAVAGRLGLPRREVYARALALAKGGV